MNWMTLIVAGLVLSGVVFLFWGKKLNRWLNNENLSERMNFGWVKEHKKMLITIAVILLVFHLYWYFHIGSIITFFTLYDIAFETLVEKYGFNEWLARALSIPTAALFAISVGLMFSLNKQKRQAGTIMVISMFTLVSIFMYFSTRDMYSGPKNFTSYGASLKKYYESLDGQIEIFPGYMDVHPNNGAKLKTLTSQKALEIEEKKRSAAQEEKARVEKIKRQEEEDKLIEAEKQRKEKLSKEIESERRSRRFRNEREDLFDRESGAPLWRYYEANGLVEIFREEVENNPYFGKKMEFLTQAKLSQLRNSRRDIEKTMKLDRCSIWCTRDDTGLLVLEGDSFTVYYRGNANNITMGISSCGQRLLVQSGTEITADCTGHVYIIENEYDAQVQLVGPFIKVNE